MEGFIKGFLMISAVVLVHTAPRQPRLSLAEYVGPSYSYNNIDGNPGMYSFGYDVMDPETGNAQYRFEERHANGTVTGTYGYIDPNGKPVKYRYIADSLGYRVYSDVITNRPLPLPLILNQPTEPSVTWTRPPKPHKNNVITHLVSELGSLLTDNNFV
ncbi:larval cuticle protein 16/17-like isoform X1 [Helicoverpa zea]|uniref:larval cuticle protein 16/17-like isoform X1 n=2 Tax=Helicoverpa zea TaxID=7113 RepID=UPI001F582D3B|nr:larval cuticle protein 16/17-like isoform X1 [Helicoverpa zea]